MGELLTPTHRMVVAVVAFVLFGGKRVSAPGYNRLIERAKDLWADATATS
jgi:Sec-independent protein translocase protein TatA